MGEGSRASDSPALRPSPTPPVCPRPVTVTQLAALAEDTAVIRQVGRRPRGLSSRMALPQGTLGAVMDTPAPCVSLNEEEAVTLSPHRGAAGFCSHEGPETPPWRPRLRFGAHAAGKQWCQDPTPHACFHPHSASWGTGVDGPPLRQGRSHARHTVLESGWEREPHQPGLPTAGRHVSPTTSLLETP